jgi:tRNA uridine 5-carbamoylmethylation protein Kti12
MVKIRDIAGVMPLVVLCGLPNSGKTTRAKEIAGYFRENCKELENIELLNEEALGAASRSVIYASKSFLKE